jgi:hypothetical protein
VGSNPTPSATMMFATVRGRSENAHKTREIQAFVSGHIRDHSPESAVRLWSDSWTDLTNGANDWATDGAQGR